MPTPKKSALHNKQSPSQRRRSNSQSTREERRQQARIQYHRARQNVPQLSLDRQRELNLLPHQNQERQRRFNSSLQQLDAFRAARTLNAHQSNVDDVIPPPP